MPRTIENSTTTCGEEITSDSPANAPGPINPLTGQHECYYVLKPEERAKGFVRPVRRTYVHSGVRPIGPIRDLTPEEHRNFNEWPACPPDWEPYVKIEERVDGTTHLWTAKRLKSGCGVATTMGQAIAETYAREPGYYGATFCIRCGIHLPVGEHGEFTWDDGSKVGT